MRSIIATWKRLGWDYRLVPFLKCLVLYGAAAHGGVTTRSTMAMAKCAPIGCLLFAVLLQRLSIPAHITECRRYSKLVALGLLLSGVGDALLVWENIVGGMAAFGLAHICYMRAWGMRPLAPNLGFVLFVIAVLDICLLKVPSSLTIALPIYVALLTGGAWRAIARYQSEIPPPGARSAAWGMALFLFSDAVLAYTMFNGPLPYQQFFIMSTYYIGQFGIAYSATEMMRLRV